MGLSKRWYYHCYDATNGSECHFHRAIRKYGPDVWTKQELCSCLTLEDAEHLERVFITEHDTYYTGYNMTEGGNAFSGLSGENNGMYGRTHTQEVKDRISELNTGRFIGMTYEERYGEEIAERMKQSRSEAAKRNNAKRDYAGSKNPNAKPVVIKGIRFNTSSDAAIYYNRSRPTISEWLRTRTDCYFI